MSALVSIDKRLIPYDFPTLTADNPSIVVQDIPNPYHGPARFQAPRPNGEADERYNIHIPANMPLGRINCTLSLVGGPKSLPTANAQYLLTTGLITGRVTGAVGAIPASVSFGTILTGQQAVETVELVGKTAVDLAGLRPLSDEKWITLHIAAGNSKTAKTLTLTVKKSAPPGLFASKVTISMANGQRLVIPVSGYITIPVR
jgi:hypothetical protein